MKIAGRKGPYPGLLPFENTAGKRITRYPRPDPMRSVDLLQNRGESHADEIQRIAGRLIATVSKPFEHQGHQLQPGASIGVALFPRDAAAPDGLFACADHAMYQAKQSGRNTFRFFQREAA